VRVTARQFRGFYFAVFWYMLELDRRLATLASEATSEFKLKIRQACLDELRTASSTDKRATKPSLSSGLVKEKETGVVVPDSYPDQSNEISVVSLGMSRSNELEDMLLKEDHRELRKIASRIASAKRERTIIITSQQFAEKLVSDLIAMRLVRPERWLRNANYRSKVELAKALGILGREEYSICCVFASASDALERRNYLPESSKAKICRIAYAHFKKQPPEVGSQRPFEEIIRLLLAILSAPWLKERFRKKLFDFRKRYRRQWSSVMKKTLWANLELLATDPNGPENLRAVEQVDLQLLRRINSENN